MNTPDAAPIYDDAVNAKEIRATCDELAADYQVPPDALQPIRDYADALERGFVDGD